jgi:acyl dehydratase
MFVYIMRRQAWVLLVAAGWFACAIAMALSVASIGYYIAFAGFGLWVCMALPGWIMMRHAGRAG